MEEKWWKDKNFWTNLATIVILILTYLRGEAKVSTLEDNVKATDEKAGVLVEKIDTVAAKLPPAH